MTTTKRHLSLGETGEYVRETIRDLREQQNLTYAELSRRVSGEHHVTEQSIRRIEGGMRRVDVDDLAAIADGLGVDAADLLPQSVREPADEPQTAAASTSAPGFRITDMFATPDIRGAMNEMAASVVTPEFREAIQGDVRELMTKVVLEGALKEFVTGVYEQGVQDSGSAQDSEQGTEQGRRSS